MKTGSVYFKNLDSIRFLAAMMVFMSHAVRPTLKLVDIDNPKVERFLWLITNGETGVSVFFVLSGFLITYLLIDEYNKNGKISLPHFYMRRVLRIWPLFFGVLVFAFAIYPLLRPFTGALEPSAAKIVYHLFFLSNFDLMQIQQNQNPNLALPQNINWSVSIEEQFYLVWPLIFLLLHRSHWIKAILSVILLSLAWRLLNYDDEYVLYYHTFSVMLDLGIGGLLAAMIQKHQTVRTFFENTSTFRHIIYFGIAYVLLYWNDYFITNEYRVAVWRLFTALSFGLIIAAQSLTKSRSVLNLGRSAIATYWGKYSYGVYMLHPIAILIVTLVFRYSPINTEMISVNILGDFLELALTLLISKLSYDYFESYFLRKKVRFQKAS